MLEGQRQRIVVIFIVCSTIATLVLGGAVAYELGRRDSNTAVATGTGAAAGPRAKSSTATAAVPGATAGVGGEVAVKSFNDGGIPIVGGLGPPEEFKYPLSYPVSTNFVTYGTAMGNRAADLGMSDVGIIVVNVGFIVPVRAELEKTLASRGIAVKDTEFVDATNP